MVSEFCSDVRMLVKIVEWDSFVVPVAADGKVKALVSATCAVFGLLLVAFSLFSASPMCWWA